MPASIVYEGLRRTAFALSEDNRRFTVSAVLFVVEDSAVKMVSIDRYRHYFFRMTTTAGAGNNLQCLILRKAAEELKGLLAKEIRTNAQAEAKIKKGS